MSLTIPHPLIAKAAHLLKTGGLVAFATETVYGLGADARQETAVAKIFAAKKRPSNHPLIVHLADIEQLTDWAINIPNTAYQLAQHFWPGPLTLILAKHPSVLDSVTGGQNSIGIRLPQHPLAQALLRAFGEGIAAPSANQFTHISPTTAQAVYEELGDQVDLILDGGPSTVGLESTIIDLTQSKPRLLRPGMINIATLETVLGEAILVGNQATNIRAPGMHHLHYAPRTKTQLITTADAINAKLPAKTILVIYSEILAARKDISLVQLPTNPKEYAQHLYSTLRALDKQRYDQILIEIPPQIPEWHAILDRLARASGVVTNRKRYTLSE